MDKRWSEGDRKRLCGAEEFFREEGGLSGYARLVQELLSGRSAKEKLSFAPPPMIDIQEGNPEEVLAGIKALPFMAEMYPVGGAADRLGTGMPAARLPFLGKELLLGLIQDLQAREYLYYTLFGEQLITPIAMMTSDDKENDRHIKELCKENDYFGRPKESIRFFSQPLVPTFNEKGEWCKDERGELILKPGGHGVIWRLAKLHGVFDWMRELGRKKVLVRQINNPVGGTDHGLLSLIGLGVRDDRSFGFASCPRRVHAKEGMNVVKHFEKHSALSNIEYTEFAKYGIEDVPVSAGSPYSKFPSNTNLLFADIERVCWAADRDPMPGKLVNFSGGKTMARIECIMQNIADQFPAEETYLTYNKRRKTISTTKKLGDSELETPQTCLMDHLRNMRELLTEHCQFNVPPIYDQPSFLLTYHPALGPLYTDIGKKIQGGELAYGAEVKLEIADLEMEKVTVKGSLLIEAENVMGHQEGNHLVFSKKVGRCVMHNVQVRNRGYTDTEDLWHGNHKREEALRITLLGHSELILRDCTIEGDFEIVVQDGERLVYEGESFLSPKSH